MDDQPNPEVMTGKERLEALGVKFTEPVEETGR
jgi:hypothetical protein